VISIGDPYTVDSIEYEILKNTISIYNNRNKKSVYIELDTIKNFERILNELRTSTSHSLLAMASITRTKERQAFLDFSSIYFPSKEVIISKKSPYPLSIRNLKNKPVGYQANSIEELSIERIASKIPIVKIPFVSYQEKVTALLNDVITFSIDDNVAVWDQPNLQIIHELEHQNGDGIAFAYPKGSKLKNRLDKYLRYYLKSAKFYNLIEQKYSAEIARYFRRNLMRINHLED